MQHIKFCVNIESTFSLMSNPQRPPYPLRIENRALIKIHIHIVIQYTILLYAYCYVKCGNLSPFDVPLVPCGVKTHQR